MATATAPVAAASAFAAPATKNNTSMDDRAFFRWNNTSNHFYSGLTRYHSLPTLNSDEDSYATDLSVKRPTATSDYNPESSGPLCLVIPKENHSNKGMMLPTPPGSPADAKLRPSPTMPLSLSLDTLARPNGHGDPSRESYGHSRLGMLPTIPGFSILAPELADSPIIARALASSAPKRPRGEKKPIPDEQKDDKYFERRKRNNMAAKKSRDARKSREDHIAVRANMLEKENAILRAQVSTLREEASSLRQLLLQKRRHRDM